MPGHGAVGGDGEGGAVGAFGRVGAGVGPGDGAEGAGRPPRGVGRWRALLGDDRDAADSGAAFAAEQRDGDAPFGDRDGTRSSGEAREAVVVGCDGGIGVRRDAAERVRGLGRLVAQGRRDGEQRAGRTICAALPRAVGAHGAYDAASRVVFECRMQNAECRICGVGDGDGEGAEGGVVDGLGAGDDGALGGGDGLDDGEVGAGSQGAHGAAVDLERDGAVGVAREDALVGPAREAAYDAEHGAGRCGGEGRKRSRAERGGAVVGVREGGGRKDRDGDAGGVGGDEGEALRRDDAEAAGKRLNGDVVGPGREDRGGGGAGAVPVEADEAGGTAAGKAAEGDVECGMQNAECRIGGRSGGGEDSRVAGAGGVGALAGRAAAGGWGDAGE